MTEESAHSVTAPPSGGGNAGRGNDPAARGATIGAGLVPEESVEGAAETASHTGTHVPGTRPSAGQPHEGLVEPGGVDTEETR
jgi:hypothetical protein